MTSTQTRYQDAQVVSSYRAETPAEQRGCDCCGQGLVNVNLVRLADGTTVALGIDCVDRVGLDAAGLRKLWAEKFAAQRDAQRVSRSAAFQAEWQARVAANEAAAAEAARTAPFRGVTSEDGLAYADALFDLAGNLLNARLVSGQYGRTWLINADTDAQEWFSPSRAQNPDRARKANAAKGFYVGTCGYRRAGNARRWWADTTQPPVVIEDNGLDLGA